MSGTGEKPFDELQLDDFLCFAIYSASHAFNRFYKPLLDELGLTYPQYLVLTALWTEDNQTVGGLGEKLFLESNTLTPLVKRVEAMGYVVRSRDPADERQVRVRLTPEGSALRAKACHVPADVLHATGLSVDALRQLKFEITNVRDSLLKASCGRDRLRPERRGRSVPKDGKHLAMPAGLRARSLVLEDNPQAPARAGNSAGPGRVVASAAFIIENNDNAKAPARGPIYSGNGRKRQ